MVNTLISCADRSSRQSQGSEAWTTTPKLKSQAFSGRGRTRKYRRGLSLEHSPYRNRSLAENRYSRGNRAQPRANALSGRSDPPLCGPRAVQRWGVGGVCRTPVAGVLDGGLPGVAPRVARGWDGRCTLCIARRDDIDRALAPLPCVPTGMRFAAKNADIAAFSARLLNPWRQPRDARRWRRTRTTGNAASLRSYSAPAGRSTASRSGRRSGEGREPLQKTAA